MKNIRLLSVVCCAGVLAAGAVSGCGKKGPAAKEGQEQAAQTAQGQEQTAGAVCMYDGIALKQEPSKNAKWLASINLGEMVQWLGDSTVDTTDKNRSYQKVRLSDGKSGWTISWGLAINAKLAAIRQNTVIYKRPDLVTGTDAKIPLMSPVAIMQEKDDWVEFISDGRRISGWLKKDALTTDPADIAVAVLAFKKLGQAKNRIAAIREFIAASPYPESFFIKKLQEEVDAAPPAPATADTPVKPADSAAQGN